MSFWRGVIYLLPGLLAFVPGVTTPQSPPPSRPNIIVFVGDDLGWRDTRRLRQPVHTHAPTSTGWPAPGSG